VLVATPEDLAEARKAEARSEIALTIATNKVSVQVSVIIALVSLVIVLAVVLLTGPWSAVVQIDTQRNRLLAQANQVSSLEVQCASLSSTADTKREATAARDACELFRSAARQLRSLNENPPWAIRWGVWWLGMGMLLVLPFLLSLVVLRALWDVKVAAHELESARLYRMDLERSGAQHSTRFSPARPPTSLRG
jgi:hypothetical protein